MANGGQDDQVELHSTYGILLRSSTNVYMIPDDALPEFLIDPKVESARLDAIFEHAPEKWEAVRIELSYRGDSTFVPIGP